MKELKEGQPMPKDFWNWAVHQIVRKKNTIMTGFRISLRKQDSEKQEASKYGMVSNRNPYISDNL